MKNLFIILFVSITYNYAFSQTWNIGTQTCLGGSLDEDIQGTLKLSNGNFLIYGTSKSGVSGDKTEPNLGNTDIWLVALNQNLQIIWEKSFGGNLLDGANKIIESSNNELYILATSASGISATKSEICFGNNDIWLIKIDLNGNIIWDKTIGGTLYETAVDILELDSGNILISGTSDSDVSGNKTSPLIGNYDEWIIKLNSNGVIIFDKTIGGLGDESDGKLLELNSNEIIICSSSTSNISGNKTENSFGGSDYWLIKIDTNGNILNNKTIGGSSYEMQTNISKLINGNFIISCTTDSPSSGLKTENNFGSYDTWILEINSQFNIIRQKTIGSNNIDGVYFAKQLINNNILIGMCSDSDVNLYKSEPRIGNSNKDQWFVVIDENFNKISDKTIGTPGIEILGNVLETSNNNFIVFGSSSGTNINDKTCVGNGSRDYWIYNLSTNLGLEEIENSSFTLYPNPVKNELSIQTDLQIEQIEIQNLEGKNLVSLVEFDNSKTISLNQLNSGIYLCKLTLIDGKMEVIKFVKE